MAIEIPQSLQKVARSAVNKVFNKYLPIPDLKALYDWFEDEGWDEIVISGLGGCVYLDFIASTDFYDDYLKEDFDLHACEIIITDEMRVAFARTRIEFYLSQADDFIHAVELKVLDLPSVFLDCHIRGQGQGGWEVEWGRAYKTEEELLSAYGDMVVMDSKDISDEKILKL